MEDKFRPLAEADFRLYKAMQEWHNRIGDMLAYLCERHAPPARIRRDCEGRFRGLAPDVTAASLMISFRRPEL